MDAGGRAGLLTAYQNWHREIQFSDRASTPRPWRSTARNRSIYSAIRGKPALPAILPAERSVPRRRFLAVAVEFARSLSGTSRTVTSSRITGSNRGNASRDNRPARLSIIADARGDSSRGASRGIIIERRAFVITFVRRRSSRDCDSNRRERASADPSIIAGIVPSRRI